MNENQKNSDTKIVSHAKVGIIGGGIMGVSLLYHLAKEGWKDLVLIEKAYFSVFTCEIVICCLENPSILVKIASK